MCIRDRSYTLKEVEAPAGYELNTNNVSLNVKSDGRVERGRGKIFAYLENNEFYFPNLKAVEPEVSLFKLGVKDLVVCSWGSCSAADGELLGGATFALYEGTAPVSYTHLDVYKRQIKCRAASASKKLISRCCPRVKS